MKILVSSLIYTCVLLSFHLFGPSFYNNHDWPGRAKTAKAHGLGDKIEMIDVENFLEYDHQTHLKWGVYRKRKLTSWPLEKLRSLKIFTFKNTYTIYQYSLIFFGLLILGSLCLKLELGKKAAIASQGIFALGYSNLFMFYTPISTYDEPTVYLLYFASFWFFASKRYFPSALIYSLSVIGRESSILMAPGFILLLYLTENPKIIFKSKKWIRPILLYCLFPLVLYKIYAQFVDFQDMDDRISKHLIRNWGSLSNIVQSLATIFFVLGLPFLIAINKFREQKASYGSNYLLSFFLVLLINGFIASTMAIAREARQFYPPVFFLLPFAGKWFLETLEKFSLEKLIATPQFLISILISLGVLYFYNPKGSEVVTVFKAYLILYLPLCSLFFQTRFFSGLIGLSRRVFNDHL